MNTVAAFLCQAADRRYDYRYRFFSREDLHLEYRCKANEVTCFCPSFVESICFVAYVLIIFQIILYFSDDLIIGNWYYIGDLIRDKLGGCTFEFV